MKKLSQQAARLLSLFLCFALLLSSWPRAAMAAPIPQDDALENQNDLYLPSVSNQVGTHDEAAQSAGQLAPQLRSQQTPEIVFHHYEFTGNLVAVTEENGEVIWRADVRPFGQGDATTSDYTLGFAGRLLEGDLGDAGGLYHMGDRYYDPVSGRFVSPDPLPLTEITVEEPQRFNRYAYGLNNPYRYEDSSGLAGDDINLPSHKETRRILAELADNPNVHPLIRRAARSMRREFKQATELLRRHPSVVDPDDVRNALRRIGEIRGLVAVREVSNSAFMSTMVKWGKSFASQAKRAAKLGGRVTGVLLIIYIVSGSEALASERYGEAAKTFADATIIGVIADGAEDLGFGTSEEFFELATTWWGDQIYEWLNEEEAE